VLTFFVASVVAGANDPVLPWRVRYKVAVGTAKALDYLHHGTSRPVIHRDVKSSNILLTSEFESQVGFVASPLRGFTEMLTSSLFQFCILAH
jgi:hypothetical protein